MMINPKELEKLPPDVRRHFPPALKVVVDLLEEARPELYFHISEDIAPHSRIWEHGFQAGIDVMIASLKGLSDYVTKEFNKE